MRKRYSRSYTVLSFLTMFSYRELPFGGSFLLSMENPQKTHSTAFLYVLQQFNIPAVLADDRAQDRDLFLELIDPALRRERF